MTSVVSQVVSGNEIKWSEVGVSAATGAASGALAATGVGLVGSIAGNAAISAVGSTANKVIEHKGFDFDREDLLDIAFDTAIGAVAGAVGGRGASCGNSKTATTLGKQLTHRVVKNGELRKAFAYYTKNMKTIGGKSIYRELYKSVLKSGVASVFGGISKGMFLGSEDV